MPNNPESIVEMIIAVRKHFGDTPWTQSDLAEFFELHAREYELPHTIQFRDISNWENDKVQLMYWQLELYSHLTDAPTGVLLLISRLAAEIRDGSLAQAIDIVTRVKQMIDELLARGSILCSEVCATEEQRSAFMKSLYDSYNRAPR